MPSSPSSIDLAIIPLGHAEETMIPSLYFARTSKSMRGFL